MGEEVRELVNEVRRAGIEANTVVFLHQSRQAFGELHHHVLMEVTFGELHPGGDLRGAGKHQAGAVGDICVRQAAKGGGQAAGFEYGGIRIEQFGRLNNKIYLYLFFFMSQDQYSIHQILVKIQSSFLKVRNQWSH